MAEKFPDWIKTTEDYERWKKGEGPAAAATQQSTKKCSKCKMDIPQGAKICPFCRTKQGISILKAVAISFFGLMVIGYLFGNNNAPSGSSSSSSRPAEKKVEQPSAPMEIVTNSAWDGSVRQVERYLKNNLKDPDSLQTIEWSEVQKTTSGGFMVRCKYRAKNSFGGYVVSNQIFMMDSKGDVTGAMDYQR